MNSTEIPKPSGPKEILVTVEFDEAISIAGYGSFHVMITIFGSVLLLANGLQNALAPYVFSAAKCELLLTTDQLAFIHVSFLLGGVASTFFWGTLADLTGRRRILMLATIVDIGISTCCAFMNGHLGLSICRFLNGCFSGAVGGISYNYIAEFHGPTHRGKSVCYVGITFTGAWLLLPVLAYVILPIPSVHLLSMEITSWRMFLIILTVPETISAVWMIFLPESPKYYFAIGDKKNSLKVLSHIYAVNKKTSPEKYPVRNLVMSVDDINHRASMENRGKLLCISSDVFRQIRILFQRKNLKLSILMTATVASNMFGFFGLGLWLPEIFDRYQHYRKLYGNSSISIVELSKMRLNSSDSIDALPVNWTTNNYSSCIPQFDFEMFINTFCLGLSCIAGNIIAGVLSSQVPRNILPSVAMIIAAIASASIYWLPSETSTVVVACVFQMMMSTANVFLCSVAVVLFPTVIAAMAFCVVLLAGRVGAIISNTVFGIFMDTSCEVPIFTVAAVVGLGGVLCFKIPVVSTKPKETTNTSKWFNSIVDPPSRLRSYSSEQSSNDISNDTKNITDAYKKTDMYI